jgi:hypothetical protein
MLCERALIPLSKTFLLGCARACMSMAAPMFDEFYVNARIEWRFIQNHVCSVGLKNSRRRVRHEITTRLNILQPAELSSN